MPEENPMTSTTTTTNNPTSFNVSTSPLNSPDQAAPQEKSNVHKKLEAFLHEQKQRMANSTSTPGTISSEGQAQPHARYDGIPGGPVSMPEEDGDARVERVSGQ